MRLAIVTRDFPPAVSGIGDHTDLLAHELASRGHEIAVLCSTPADSRTKFDVRPVIERFDAAALGAALKDAAPEAILWQYNPFSIGRKGVALNAGALAKTMAKHAPLVLVGHELWFPWGREGARGAVWSVTQRAEAVAIFRASRRIVVTTESRLATLHRWFRKRRNDVSLIPIGANIEPDATQAQDGFRARAGIDEEAFVVAHVGSAGAGRDLRPLFEAIRRLRAEGTDARLLLIGRGGDAHVPHGLEDAVTPTGVLSREDVSRALSASNAYVFCEPSGPAAGRKGSFLAALAHGLPIVAFNGPDRDSQLRNGDNVLLVEPRADTVTRSLRSLARDGSLRARLSEGARRLYEGRFSWPVVGDAFETLLKGL